MHLKRNDGWATLFVMAAVVLWAVWETGAAFGGVSTRVVAAGVLALGYAACMTDQPRMPAVYGVGGPRRVPIAYVVVASILGGGALVVGVITLVGGSEAMLVVLVAAILALWLVSTARHAISDDEQPERRVTARASERPA